MEPIAISAVFATLKGAIGLAKTAANAELIDKLATLQLQFSTVHEKLSELQDQNRELRAKLDDKQRKDSLRDRREYRDNAYWVDGQGPYCPGCWDGNGKDVRMSLSGPGRAVCPNCDHIAIYDQAALNATRRSSGPTVSGPYGATWF